MRKLIIEQTTYSPKVILDHEKNLFEISGESKPPDVAAFYLNIIRWFDDYSEHLDRSQSTGHPGVLNFDFQYFNTSSAKYILDLCKKIGDVRSKGINLEIKWHYEEDDPDMLEAGREMSKLAKFPFEFVQKN